MIQDTVFYTSLLLIAAFAVVFLLVVSRAGETTDGPAPPLAGRLRVGLFWLLLLGGVAYSFATLLPMPIPAQDALAATQPVQATASQWSWNITPSQVRAGDPVQFTVISEDVNHGFGIYDPNMVLLAQTQAMPGYTNRLTYTFENPGRYQILCLEYCGLVHHGMTAELTVLPGDSQGGL